MAVGEPRRTMRLAALAALPATVLALGCASHPPITQLTLVTTRTPSVQARILARDIEGDWCFTQSFVTVLLTPPWMARRANHGFAVADALDRVPEANVLVNVRFEVRVQQFLLFQRTCAIARGDAAVLP